MDISKLYEYFEQSTGVCHDTRKLLPKCMYWAITGERLDGHQFVAQALEGGAAYAVVSNEKYVLDERCLLVGDTLAALQEMARFHRRLWSRPVIAIAGSNGKTTTKELLRSVLAEKFSTFATPGNFNNHIGLPLSLLQINHEHELAVLELGANHPGENRLLAEICEPDYGLVTNIGKDHLEGFGTIENTAKANAELFDYLSENNGISFLNADDQWLVRFAPQKDVIRYGIKAEDLDYAGRILESYPALKVHVERTTDGKGIEVSSNLIGGFHLYNILAAVTAGRHFLVDWESIKAGLEKYIPQNNRSQVLERDGRRFILDAYNANPSSMEAAIEAFSGMPAPHKVLIMGDMLELGADAPAEHNAMLEKALAAGFEQVLLVGQAFSACSRSADCRHFPDTQSLKKWFDAQEWGDSVFYLKASRGIGLEKLLE